MKNDPLRFLITIFQPDGYDWMNFAISKSNPYTYHHILERKNGGDVSIDNGAILTKRAHRFLHILQVYCPEAYNDLQDVFRRINDSKEPVTQQYVDEIDEIMRKIFVTGEYKVLSEEIDLSEFCVNYKSNRKIKRWTK